MGGNNKDYYKILGIDRSASADEIQKAYKKLARKYHPDLNPGNKEAEDKFKDIGEAYDVLKDPQKKSQYDMFGSNFGGAGFTPPPGGFGGFNFGGGAGGRNVQINLNDLLGGLGGMGGGRGGFNLGDILNGMGGMGGQGFSSQGFGGQGFGGQGFSRGASQTRTSDEAPAVDLKLSVVELLELTPKSISITQGGMTRSIRVNIPKGAKDKTIFKLKGQAPDGGDLRIRVNIDDAEYRTDEFDIIQKLKITPWEAALGTQLDVRTLEGSVHLTIPPCVQSGQKLRIHEKGLYKKQGRGDLLMEIQICVPKPLSAKEKELFKQISEVSSFNPRNT